MTSNTFPTDADLKACVAEHVSGYTAHVKNAVGELSDAYFQSLKTRTRGWKVLGWSAAGIFIGLVVSDRLPWVSAALLVSASIASVWGFKMVRAADQQKIRQVIRQAHQALLPDIAEAAGVRSIQEVVQQKKDRKDFDAEYTKPGENAFQRTNRLLQVSVQLSTTYDHDELIQKLEQSALLAEVQDTIRVLLMLPLIYTVETTTKTLRFSQLLGRPLAAGDGASQDLKNFVRRMAKSLFIEVPLSQTFTGTTVVTVEKLPDGSEQDLYVKSLRKIGLNVSKLEWNDFEKLLHVITDDEVEARYILTPDFMESVYTWWKEKKQDIRISFTGNSMNILIFGSQVNFFGDLADVSEAEIKRHVEATLIPLVHSLYLVNAYTETR